MSTPRLDSNSALDFLFFFVELILVGVLVPGDFFVVDNSPVHYSEEIAAALEAIEAASGVRCPWFSFLTRCFISLLGCRCVWYICPRIHLSSILAS